MFASLPLIFLGLGLLFSVPSGLSGVPLFVYVTAMALILRFGLSAFTVPYIALGAELTDDYLERSSVIAWRSFFSVPATIVPLVLGYGVFMSGKHGLFDRAAYVPFGWTCAIVLTVLALLAAWDTLGSLDRLHKTVPSDAHPLLRLARELPEVFRNRSFVILFITVLIFFVAQGSAAVLVLHASKFFWKLDVPTIQFLSIVGALGLLVGLPIVWLIGPHVEKRTMTLWSLAFICVSQAGMPLLRIWGLLPPNGPMLVTVLAVNNVLVFGAVTVLVVAFQSMMADAADEHELLFGARREGLYFSGTTFSTKAASGLGNFIAGAALDLIHFPVAIANKGGDNLHLATSTVTDLGLVYGVAPAAMTAICILVNSLYRIDRHAHARIQAALAQRRAATVANTYPASESLP